MKSHVKNHHKMSVAQRSAVIREIVEASGGQIKTKMRDAGKIFHQIFDMQYYITLLFYIIDNKT